MINDKFYLIFKKQIFNKTFNSKLSIIWFYKHISQTLFLPNFPQYFSSYHVSQHFFPLTRINVQLIASSQSLGWYFIKISWSINVIRYVKCVNRHKIFFELLHEAMIRLNLTVLSLIPVFLSKILISFLFNMPFSIGRGISNNEYLWNLIFLMFF